MAPPSTHTPRCGEKVGWYKQISAIPPAYVPFENAGRWWLAWDALASPSPKLVTNKEYWMVGRTCIVCCQSCICCCNHGVGS
eukprot:12537916-Prorocentrum_lima.AAC.1